MTLVDLWNLIQAGGIAFLLFIALFGVFKGFWYPGYMYRDLEKDRDEWKAIALENLRVSSGVVDELKARSPRGTKGA